MKKAMITEQPNRPKVIPKGTDISSIDDSPVHPFKLNLTNISDPLVISNTISNTKILPNSVVA
jgi:hypothetical protein